MNIRKKLITVPTCKHPGCNESGIWDGKCIGHRDERNWTRCSTPGCPIWTLNITGTCFLHRGTSHKPSRIKVLEGQYSTGEVAAMLGVDPRTVRRWISLGKVRPTKTVGGHHRFTSRQIEKLSQLGAE